MRFDTPSVLFRIKVRHAGRADVDDVATGELELLGLAARQLRPGVGAVG